MRKRQWYFWAVFLLCALCVTGTASANQPNATWSPAGNVFNITVKPDGTALGDVNLTASFDHKDNPGGVLKFCGKVKKVRLVREGNNGDREEQSLTPPQALCNYSGSISIKTYNNADLTRACPNTEAEGSTTALRKNFLLFADHEIASRVDQAVRQGPFGGAVVDEGYPYTVNIKCECRPRFARPPLNLPDGTIGANYYEPIPSFQPGATVASGSPPPGLNLDSSGKILGTPTQEGTFTFIIGRRPSGFGATAAERCDGYWQPVTIVIRAPRVISPGVALDRPTLTPKYCAQYVAGPVPATVRAGARFTVPMTVKNCGGGTWYPRGDTGGVMAGVLVRNVKLSYHWAGPAPLWDGSRTMLAAPVPPGASAQLTAEVLAPVSPGDYRLSWDMVEEFAAWFSSQGVKTLDFNVRVTP